MKKKPMMCSNHKNNQTHEVPKKLEKVMLYDCCGIPKGTGYIKKTEAK